MKENELDKLFKRKLRNKEQISTSEAWEKLSHDLEKGKKKAWYVWSAAAVVLLISGLGLYFMLQNEQPGIHNGQSLVEVENGDNLKNTQPDAIPELANGDSSLQKDKPSFNDRDDHLAQHSTLQLEKMDTEPKTSSTTKTDNNSKTGTSDSKNEVLANTNRVLNEPPIRELDEKTEALEPEEPLVEIKEREPLLANNDLEQNKEDYPEVKIVYKKSAETSIPPQASLGGLKKVVALAKDIKEGEYGLGDLREAKNELLAFGLNKISED